MAIRVLYLWLVVMAVITDLSFSRPSTQFDERIRRLVESDDVQGYDVATVLAVDPVSNEEKRQTRRDLEQHASDLSSDERHFTLLLTFERMHISVIRRPFNVSAITVSEVTEEGETKQLYLEIGNCFFTGTVKEQKGVVSISLCDGKLSGSVTTETRDYEIHPLVKGLGKNGSVDDVVLVLVTWTDAEYRSMTSELEMAQQYLTDGLEISEESSAMSDESRSDEEVRRSISDRKVTIEIADFVDKYYIAALKRKYEINTTEEIVEFILIKWKSAAHVFSNVRKTGWNITLRLVEVGLWRSDPAWYPTSPKDKIGERMRMACHGTYRRKYDQATLHTSKISNIGLLGVAWVGGLCRNISRCAAVRHLARNPRVELHEFGHSLGLRHEDKISFCHNDSDPLPGFMGGSKYHFKSCYKKVLDKTFTNPRKKCVYRNDNPNYVRDFHSPSL